MVQGSDAVIPHGGQLVERLVPAASIQAIVSRAAGLPRLVLDARELADLELLAVGAASPLRGFLGKADYACVLSDLRLADGTIWPLPFTLAVDNETKAALRDAAALYDFQGRLWGLIDISAIFDRDPDAESRAIYGTTDHGHPGVAYLQQRPRWLVGGDVHVLPLPEDLPCRRYRLTPRQLRAEIEARGWRRIAGFQTAHPIHRAQEYLTKLALEVADGLVIHPLVWETQQDGVSTHARFTSYKVLIDKYYPKDRTLLSAFPAAVRHAGPREALLHAMVSKNYGITHVVVGPDHAGIGKHAGPSDVRQIFDRFAADEIGVTPLEVEPTFYCRLCEAPASTRTCPHGPSSRLEISGTRVQEILGAGGELPREFTRPEVADVLRQHYGGRRRVAEAPHWPMGAILWFTGLSGAGKSTLSQAVRETLARTWRVEILDGDEIRVHLSRGLGFSKEDRDTNIRRIGLVARLLARNGVMAITAAISPYRDVRDEIRALAARDGVPFIEIHAHADVEALATRDVKGLYRKALAGELPNFTGVTDPYEPPLNPEIVVRSDRETVEESRDRILAYLQSRGLMASTPVEVVL